MIKRALGSKHRFSGARLLAVMLALLVSLLIPNLALGDVGGTINYQGTGIAVDSSGNVTVAEITGGGRQCNATVRQAQRRHQARVRHRQQAKQAGQEKQWFAAALHLGKLADLRPWNAKARANEARAWQKAGQQCRDS